MARRRIAVEDLEFHPLTPERWPDLVDLFGERGAWGGCWCMWWRLPAAEFDRLRGEGTKRLFHGLVEAGPPPGILAYSMGKPVGWCAVGPREVYVRLASSPQYRTVLAPVDELPVWSAVCFYVRPGYRRQGITVPLLQAAVSYAASCGARIVEGYPVDKGWLPAPSAWTGPVETFRRAGFVEVCRRVPHRPIFRCYP
ncbi:MAG: GNAT family N-acetyltransferase [Candidatus Bipolaricaulota bacterium]|nr:GNAT family N-acetyltransferase [Candidatus Bipolaricaulota bacterium]